MCHDGNVGISLALDSWLSYHALLFLALFIFSSLLFTQTCRFALGEGIYEKE